MESWASSTTAHAPGRKSQKGPPVQELGRKIPPGSAPRLSKEQRTNIAKLLVAWAPLSSCKKGLVWLPLPIRKAIADENDDAVRHSMLSVDFGAAKNTSEVLVHVRCRPEVGNRRTN